MGLCRIHAIVGLGAIQGRKGRVRGLLHCVVGLTCRVCFCEASHGSLKASSPWVPQCPLAHRIMAHVWWVPLKLSKPSDTPPNPGTRIGVVLECRLRAEGSCTLGSAVCLGNFGRQMSRVGWAATGGAAYRRSFYWAVFLLGSKVQSKSCVPPRLAMSIFG